MCAFVHGNATISNCLIIIVDGCCNAPGAAVDEHVAAEAQKLDRSMDPVGELQASEEKAKEVREPVSTEETAPEPAGNAEVLPIAPTFAGESAPVAPMTASEVNDAPALPVKENPSSDAAEEEKKEEQQEEEEEKKEDAEEVREEPKEQVLGTKRPAEESAEGEDELALKIAKYEVDPSDPNAEYFRLIAEIPSGETRTFTDIALGAGAKATMARSIGRTLAKVAAEDPGLPWWRVVSAMGALQSNPERQELQLERLRAEGARPREDEGVADWAARVGTKIVGTYALGSLRMVHAEADNDDVSVRLFISGVGRPHVGWLCLPCVWVGCHAEAACSTGCNYPCNDRKYLTIIVKPLCWSPPNTECRPSTRTAWSPFQARKPPALGGSPE